MKLFKIFLASPGDTKAERLAAEEAVDEINKSIGSRDGFRLELLKWEDDTYPSIGEDGQDVINKQMLFGDGITATVFYDISDRWTVGGSVGHEYLPKMDILGNGLGAEIAFSAFTIGANVLWRF